MLFWGVIRQASDSSLTNDELMLDPVGLMQDYSNSASRYCCIWHNSSYSTLKVSSKSKVAHVVSGQ